MVVPVVFGEYAVVVGGGDVSDLLLPVVRRASLKVAADSGAEFLESRGIEPDILVGDFDSCDSAVVKRIAQRGARVVALPVDKDITDTEAALDIVLKAGHRSAVLVGALGGERIEHGVANIFLVERYARKGLDVTLMSPKTSVTHVSGPGYAGIQERVFRGQHSDWVSLFPVTARVRGVTTRNLKFPLDKAVLRRGRTLGVSNQMLGEEASVSAEEGFLVVILTGG